MKIAVVGAGGMVGQDLVAELASQNHELSLYTRSGRTLPAGPSTALELTDTAAVVAVINSHDVTVISVASRDNYEQALAAHQALIAAKPAGRFIVVGGAGALQAGAQQLYQTADFPAAYYPEAKTFAEILAAYQQASGLDWTMAAPSPMIAPGIRTGNIVTAADEPAGDFVSTQDFAVGIASEIAQPAYRGRRFTIASQDAAAAGAGQQQ